MSRDGICRGNSFAAPPEPGEKGGPGRRPRAVRFVLALVAAALPLGCAGPAASPDGAHVLIYGRAKDATTLDPASAEDGESVKIITNVFDTLVHYADDSADLVPALATEWTVSEDGKTWRVRLREGVRFHDGTEFDSEAVVFTFERLIDPEHFHGYGATRPYLPDYSVIERVEVAGPLEVVFTLRRPSGVFLRLLAMFPASIVSPEAVMGTREQFGVRPVGTGPFRFEEWIKDERLTLVANPDHWRGVPKVDRVIFKPILESEARRRQLTTGEIHMADELSIPTQRKIADDPDLVLETRPGLNTAYLALNNERPPFDDVRVRRAVAHAIDKEAIRRSAYDGEGEIATTLVPRSMWGHNANVRDYPYDPGRARELLKEAGLPKGAKIRFFAMRNGRPYMPAPEQVAAIVVQQLREVGFSPEIESPDWSQYLEQVGQGEHDCALFGWITDTADPDNFLFTLLDRTNAVKPKAHNVSFYRSEPVHQLLVEAQTEVDQEKRKNLYLQAQEIIHEDCPLVPLMHLDLAVGMRKEVKGYVLHPTGLVVLRNVELAD